MTVKSANTKKRSTGRRVDAFAIEAKRLLPAMGKRKGRSMARYTEVWTLQRNQEEDRVGKMLPQKVQSGV